MSTATLTARDAYFVKHADLYRQKIEKMKRQNQIWQEIVDRWPDGDAIPELKGQIAKNESEIKQLSAKALVIMANVRR